jgi:GPH family glycoside/pentoside/hexuronide:cation symporter/probable glucitol transport protein GutA
MRRKKVIMKISLREKTAYSVGSIGNNLINGLMTTYLIVFYTDYMLLPAFTISILFLTAKIWDGINDPIMGIIIDNTNTRFGKFRPYLLFMPLIVGIFTVLCFFNPGLGVTGNTVWAFVTFILFGMSFTAMDIPYWAMTPSLTQDTDERSKIVTMSRTFAMAGFFIAVVAVYPILVDSFGGGSRGWTLTAALFSVVGILLTLLTFFNTKERIVVKRKKRQTLSDVRILMKANTPLLILMIALFAVEVSNITKIVFPVYYFEHNLQMKGILPVFLAVYALSSLTGGIISPFISKKTGKKRCAIAGVIVMGLSGILHYLSGYSSLLPIIIFNGIGALGFGASNIAMMSMLTDTVEYGEWKTGNRAEGMVYSTNVFKSKMAAALGGVIGSAALGAFGYKAGIVLPESTLGGIHMMISLVPGLLALSGIIPLLKYKLTEAKYEKILQLNLREKEKV